MKLRLHFAFVAAAILAGMPLRTFADAIYAASAGGDEIKRIGANGAQSTFLGSIVDPFGLVFDSAGNLYVSSSAGGTITKYPADGGTPLVLANGLNSPTGLALKDDDYLYAAISGANSVIKIPTSGGAPTTFASLTGAANPQGIAFDDAGSLYVANKGTSSVSKITSGGNVSAFLTSADVTAPVGVGVAASGKIAVLHAKNGGEILEFNSNGHGKGTTIATSLGTPTGLAIDSIGNYYVSTAANKVVKVAASADAAFTPDISGVGLLVTRARQLDVIAFNNEVLNDPTNTKFASLGAPIAGAGGDVAYSGKLVVGVSGVTASDDSGIWKTSADGSRRLVAREGKPAPDVVGATNQQTSPVFGAFSDPVINANGDVAFCGTLRKNVNGAAAGTLIGLWAEVSNKPVQVVRQGDGAPGITGAKFTAFQQFALPDAGGLVFQATVSGAGVTSGTNAGIWADNGSGPQLVVRKGDYITVNSVTMVSKKVVTLTLMAKTPFSMGQTRSFGADGDLLFRAKFSDGSSALIAKNYGEFGPSALKVVAYSKEQLSQAIPGAAINPSTGSVNADCSVAFLSSLTGTGITKSNNRAVFRRKADQTLEVVAQKSFIAPDATDGKFLAFSDPALNDNGEVAFRATLAASGPTSVTGKNSGLWLGLPGNPRLVARQGDLAVGVSGEVKFTSFSQFCAPADGGLVFVANIAGSGITTANNQGVWQRDASGGLDLVLRKGDKIPITDNNGAADRTIVSITAFNAPSLCTAQGRTAATNGDIALLLKFSDKSQAIVRATLP